MKILCIADPINQFNIHKDSTYLMIKTLWQQGHAVDVATVDDLFIENGTVQVRAQTLLPADINLNSTAWYQYSSDTKHTQAIHAQTYQAVLMRKDPPYDMEYIYATHMLDMAEKAGTAVLNSGRALRDFPEKLSIFNFLEYITPTLVCKDADLANAFITHGTQSTQATQAIIKPLDKMGGEDVFLLQASDVNSPRIIERMLNSTVQQGVHNTVMLQSFIPEIAQGDKRILIIGRKIISHALARIPGENSIRGNLASGGHGVVQALNQRDLQIAGAVQSWMLKQGIFLAGIDVIGEYLTEINITSPTCFHEISAVVPDVMDIWYNEFLHYLDLSMSS